MSASTLTGRVTLLPAKNVLELTLKTDFVVAELLHKLTALTWEKGAQRARRASWMKASTRKNNFPNYWNPVLKLVLGQERSLEILSSFHLV